MTFLSISVFIETVSIILQMLFRVNYTFLCSGEWAHAELFKIVMGGLDGEEGIGGDNLSILLKISLGSELEVAGLIFVFTIK